MYSLDLRNSAVRHYLKVRSLRKVAGIFHVGKSTLDRWVKPIHTARNARKRRRAAAVAHIEELVTANPFTTLSKLKASLATEDIKVSCTTSWRILRDSGYSRKRARHRSSQRQPSLEECEQFVAALETTGERISIDEVCIYLHESPHYGYAPRGERVIHRTKKPPRSNKLSMLLAISDKRGIVAHKCLAGSFNTASFTDFLNNMDAVAGTPVILDSVSFHRSKAAIEVARVKGYRLLYTPPYSPDFNPVENAFSVLKNAMRQQEPVALQDALTTITAAKCAAFFSGSSRIIHEYTAGLRGLAAI